MAAGLVAARFPNADLLARGRWAPIFLTPIMGSPERFVVAVVAWAAGGFHIEAANELSRLSCLYGRAAETALFATEVALDVLGEQLLKRGGDALTEGQLVFSGVSIGPISEGEARTVQDLARTWMATISSLYQYRPETSDLQATRQRGTQADQLPILVLNHVTKIDPRLDKFFHEDIRQNRQRRASSGVARINIDFSGEKLVANFATLKSDTQALAVDRIKRKMFDLTVRRDEESKQLFVRRHEMIVFTPITTNELVDDALQDLSQQSGREGFALHASNDVAAIGQRVVTVEAIAAGRHH